MKRPRVISDKSILKTAVFALGFISISEYNDLPQKVVDILTSESALASETILHDDIGSLTKDISTIVSDMCTDENEGCPVPLNILKK